MLLRGPPISAKHLLLRGQLTAITVETHRVRGLAWTYHQGIPFIAVTTAIVAPSSGANDGAESYASCAFSAQITKSCALNARGSSCGRDARRLLPPLNNELEPAFLNGPQVRTGSTDRPR